MKLKIGPVTFTVIEVTDLVVGGKTVWGDADMSTSTIKVEDALADGPKRTTLLHEVVHVCLDFAGYREAAQNDGLINALAHGLLQVLRDNPTFTERLLSE